MVRMVCDLCGASLPRLSDRQVLNDVWDHEENVHPGKVVVWKKVKG